MKLEPTEKLQTSRCTQVSG